MPNPTFIPGRSNSRSGVMGTHWLRHRRKWRAEITRDGRRTFLGYFDLVSEAGAAYAAARSSA